MARMKRANVFKKVAEDFGEGKVEGFFVLGFQSFINIEAGRQMLWEESFKSTENSPLLGLPVTPLDLPCSINRSSQHCEFHLRKLPISPSSSFQTTARCSTIQWKHDEFSLFVSFSLPFNEGSVPTTIVNVFILAFICFFGRSLPKKSERKAKI